MYQDFAAAYAKDRAASLIRTGQPRKRAAGGGTPFSQDGRTRLLMTWVFLRVYPTYEVLATLEAHTVFVCECPADDRRKLRSVQAVMDAFLTCAWSLVPKNSASRCSAMTMTGTAA